MKSCLFLSLLILVLLSACNPSPASNQENKANISIEAKVPKIQNKGHQLVYDMVQKVGSYQDLLSKKDVNYTYTYQTSDGKKDVSTERYIFDGELSYGSYQQHERTLASLEGTIEQGYDGKEYWLKHDGKYLTDEKRLKRVAFNRPTNFYWFTMMQKLLDEGLSYEYIGEKIMEDRTYDIVKISFKSSDNKPTDIYQVYINRQTKLVDQFLFTVADFGLMEPKLMQVEHEQIEGFFIPTKRKYKNSNWEAEVTDEPWILVNWTDISFNNGLARETFKKK